MRAESETAPAKQRKPDWFRLKLPTSPVYGETTDLVRKMHLHTVCESAHCPNRWECWSRKSATFMVAGDKCTRACSFCAVDTAKPQPLDPGEPLRVAHAVQSLGLRHVVVTMVARDDLEDGAAGHVADVTRAIRGSCPKTVIEVLTSDFNGRRQDIAAVIEAAPQIFNHNIETVERLTPTVRFRAQYRRSLQVLATSKELAPAITTKSGMMLGVGEVEEEIRQALQDLRSVGVEMLTLGQYLQPSPKHLEVSRWVTPEEFDRWALEARQMGFKAVASGPLIRSSYYADAVNLESLGIALPDAA